MQRNVFSKTLEHLLETLKNDCVKVKLVLDHQEINNAPNETPVADHFFCQKGTGSWYSIVYHKKIQAPNWVFSSTNHFKKLVRVVSVECRTNIEKTE